MIRPLLIFVVFAPLAWAIQPEASTDASGSDPLADAIADLPLDDLAARLAALDPADPEGYYLLGEEVASAYRTPEQLALARRLYVLAFHLDRDRNGRLGPSICLALADLIGVGRDREWLIALAHALDPRYATPDWRGASPSEASDETAYRAATAVGRVRAGQGRRAMELLEDQRVMDIIERYQAVMSPIGRSGAADWLRREARRWPCPECGFDRVNRAIDGAAGAYVPCRVCLGNPGPRLSEEELLAHLRFEARLLNGIQRSWSAQVIADGGGPLRDPQAEDLPSVLGVDVRRTIWRDGAWIEPPEVDPDADGAGGALPR